MKFKPIFPSLLEESATLYENAFPAAERRPTHDWCAMMQSVPNFHANAIIENGTFAGILTSWDFGDFTYVEHFAILSELRGGGYGSHAFQMFLNECTHHPVVFEVEMPETENARRRIAFYERQGMTLLPFTYIQPAYVPGGPTLSLKLMSSNSASINEATFHKIKAQIWRSVYHYEEPCFEKADQ